MLYAACSKCHSQKFRCSGVLGCSQCTNVSCLPSVIEWEKRAKKVFNSVAEGTYVHNDIAKYQIYLETMVYTNRKVFLGRADIQDILSRIGSDHDKDDGIDDPLYTPDKLMEFSGTSACYKIEWMHNGHYTSSCSDWYASNIMSSMMCTQSAKKARVPPKVMDTCNLGDEDIAYKLWCKSICSPETEVSYTGPGYWKELTMVIYTTVKMMTAILSPTRIVTVTCITHGDVRTMN